MSGLSESVNCFCCQFYRYLIEVGSKNETDGYWIRNKDKFFITTAKRYLGITAGIQISSSATGIQWRLKIVRATDVKKIRKIFKRHGWAPRKAEERPYPSGNVNDIGFVRAWVELHSSIDIAHTGRKRRATPRLRIYGNKILIEDINSVISAGTGLPLRKPQKTTGGKTFALYYTGQGVQTVIKWLYNKAELFNPTVKEKYEEILTEF